MGIRGSAGSGKDTVAYLFAGALNYYIEHSNGSFCDFTNDEWYYYWNDMKKNALAANGNILHSEGAGDFSNIYFETFADNVKIILSMLTGIEYEKFYDSSLKENLYFNFATFENCLKDNLLEDAIILTDDECINMVDNNNINLSIKTNYWISMRSLMVYFGTHIIQRYFGKKAWVNSLSVGHMRYIDNSVRIISDCRFPHELKYIRDNNGIVLQVQSNRNKIKESNSVAETSLIDNKDYDIIIDNSGTLDNLLPQFFEIIEKYF